MKGGEDSGLALRFCEPSSQSLARIQQRLPDDLAKIEQAKLERAGPDAMHFAWAGDERPRHPHYYRLQAPTFIVEYDNTQDDANHVHTVWRDPDGDFGSDVLREHLRREH